MAASVGYATLQIVPSIRGIEKSISSDLRGPLSRASSSAGNESGNAFAAGFARTLKGAGKTLAVAASVGFAAAGAGLVALGGFGLKAAADFEQTRIAFEGIFGSATRANTFLEDLRKFAAGTPFEFPELTTSAKNLLAVGFASEDVIPIMTKLGNVAATLGVGGAEIQGVVRALGQMKGKGKASAEELQQISEQIPGFSAIEAIAQKLGVTTSEAFDKMAEGAIPANVAIEAILEGMDRFPGAAGAMERQSKTLNGVISTFKDTVRDALVRGIEPLLPAISGIFSKVGPLVGDALNTASLSLTAFFAALKEGDVTSDGVVGFFERIGAALHTLGQLIVENKDVILAALGSIATTAGNVFGRIAEFVTVSLFPAFRDIGLAIAEVAPKVFELASGLFDLLFDVLTPIVPIVGRVIAVLVRFAGVLIDNKDALLVIGAAIAPFVIALKAISAAKTVITALQTLRTAVLGVNAAFLANPIVLIVAAVVALGAAIFVAYKKFEPFRNVVDTVGRALRDAFGAAVTWITDTAVPALVTAFDAVKSALSAVFEFITNNWKTILAIIAPPLLLLISAVKLVVSNFDAIVGAVQAVIRVLKPVAKALIVPFAPLIALAIAIIKNWSKVSAFFVDLAGVVSDVWNTIVSVISDALDVILDSAAFGAFVDFVKSTFGTLVDYVVSTFNSIKTVISGAIDVFLGLFETFKALLTFQWGDAWNGLVRVVSGVWQIIQGVVGQAVNIMLTVLKVAWDTMKTTAKAAFDAVVGFVRDLPGRIVSFATHMLLAGATFAGKFIEGILSAIGGAAGAAVDIAQEIWSALAGFINEKLIDPIREFHVRIDPPGPGVLFDGNPFGSIPRIPEFATGGVVPGPRGAPVLAVVHGGEEVLTPAQRGRGGQTNNFYGITDTDGMIAALQREQRRQTLLAG